MARDIEINYMQHTPKKIANMVRKFIINVDAVKEHPKYKEMLANNALPDIAALDDVE